MVGLRCSRELAWSSSLTVDVRFGLFCSRWKIGLDSFTYGSPPRPEIEFGLFYLRFPPPSVKESRKQKDLNCKQKGRIHTKASIVFHLNIGACCPRFPTDVLPVVPKGPEPSKKGVVGMDVRAVHVLCGLCRQSVLLLEHLPQVHDFTIYL